MFSFSTATCMFHGTFNGESHQVSQLILSTTNWWLHLTFMNKTFSFTRYVQQKTNSPVDMRVGIHTGAILAGILGQRQWQYDVYSKDVVLANKMESSGKAGYVDDGSLSPQFMTNEATLPQNNSEAGNGFDVFR